MTSVGSFPVQRLALGEQPAHRGIGIAVEQRAVLAARRPLGEHRRIGAQPDDLGAGALQGRTVLLAAAARRRPRR